MVVKTVSAYKIDMRSIGYRRVVCRSTRTTIFFYCCHGDVMHHKSVTVIYESFLYMLLQSASLIVL